MSGYAILISAVLIMGSVLVGITLISHLYSLNRIKSRTVGDGQHGTARWATKAEIRKTYEHIPFTPDKWRRQAANNTSPTLRRKRSLNHSIQEKRKTSRRLSEKKRLTLPVSAKRRFAFHISVKRRLILRIPVPKR